MVVTFTDQIRFAIQDSGVSRYALSKRTGVTQAALCRFMKRQTGLTTDTLDRLAGELDLRVVSDALYAATPRRASRKRVIYAKMAAHPRKQRTQKGL
jgi:transcriptional regulator with XRE-family HTH domain